MTKNPKRLIATPDMAAVLRDMREQGKGERATQQPLLDLPTLHWRTRDALVARDFIVVSKRLHEVDGRERYQLTPRGLKALAELERRTRPRVEGDLCYTCKTNPRHVSRGGQRRPYCLSCHRTYERARLARQGTQYDPNKPCGRCKTAARHITRTGVVEEYCQACKRLVAVGNRVKYLQRLRERALAGEFVPCRKCKTNAIYITDTQTFIYCEACARQVQKATRQRRKARLYQRVRLAHFTLMKEKAS